METVGGEHITSTSAGQVNITYNSVILGGGVWLGFFLM